MKNQGEKNDRDERLRIVVHAETHAQFSELKKRIEGLSPKGVTYSFDGILTELLNNYGNALAKLIENRHSAS